MPNVSLHEPGFTVEYRNHPVVAFPFGFAEPLSVADVVVTELAPVVVTVGGVRLNVAVTVLSAVMVSEHVFGPVLVHPENPANVEPDWAVAVRVAMSPLTKEAEQVPGHEMYGIEFVTVPVLVPARTMVRM